MKLIIVATLALVAAVSAAPAAVDPSAEAQIVRSEFEQQPDGAFVSSFENTNGIQVQATGELKEALDEENKPHTVVVIRGSYQYPREDGTLEKVTYFADETGYHAEGDSIPKEPLRR